MKLLYNANIHTLDEKHPLASAILIAGSQVIAVGEKDKLESLAHGKVEKQDMKGKLIIPGMTDAHIHIQYYSLGLAKVDCETKTKAECLQRVAERARNSKPGEWVLGHGWNQNEWSFHCRSGRKAPGYYTCPPYCPYCHCTVPNYTGKGRYLPDRQLR